MPTFTPEDEKQKQRDIGQEHYDQVFNDIARAEENAEFDNMAKNFDSSTADSGAEDANIKKLQEKESEGSQQSGDWKNNTEPKEEASTGKLKGVFKKGGPSLGILGVVGIGGFIMLALASPSLLIVQMKETMVGKFNTQLSSMDARTNKLIYTKINNSTKGLCNSVVSIRCKFTSMSDKQVAKLKAAGIEVEGKKGITGRTTPTSLKFKDGPPITAKTFATTAGNSSEFRNALKQAYNPKYAGFAGKAWANVAAKFKISKQPPELNAEEGSEEARKKINSIAEEGSGDTGSRTPVVADDADCEGDCITEEEANKINETADNVAKEMDDGSPAKIVRQGLSKVGGSATVTSALKATGTIDAACQVYGAVATLSYAAKAIRAAQLVRYSMIFFSVADAIKAGKSPNPKDVELLGSILTTTVQDTADPTKTAISSATDSYGYKYAAYGDVTGSEKSLSIANRFMAGGGLAGDLSSKTNLVLSFIPGGRKGAHDTCGTLANPAVQAGSIVVGIALLLVPGVNIGKAVIQGAASIAAGAVLLILPGMLADIVAGTVTKDIVGEEAGNAITSGSGALMSDSLAAQNGNAPMSKEDALAYNSMQTETSNQYIADELENTSPFDATNPNTFVGSIVANLIPLQSKSNPVSFFGSLLATSAKSIIPTSNAASTQAYADSLDVCQDLDVIEAGYAADPFCNVIRGIPPKYLNKDPLVIVDQLVAAGDLSEEGAPIGDYQEFINSCITNVAPLGYQDVSKGYDNDAATDCVIKDENANYYLNYMDQRIEVGMSGEDTEGSTGASSVVDASTTVDVSKLYTDSSSVECAAGTEDAGIETGYYSGKPITVHLCNLPNTVMSNSLSAGHPRAARVNSRASGVAYAMFEKMRTDLGVDKITINDSFRTMAEQQAAKTNYGSQAATPGYSNHQMGYAFDINMSVSNGGPISDNRYTKGENSSYPDNKVYAWLKKNAKSFHFSQYAPEGWHWSINGN